MLNSNQVEQVHNNYFKSICKGVSALSVVDVYTMPAARKANRIEEVGNSIRLGSNRVLITNIRPPKSTTYLN